MFCLHTFSKSHVDPNVYIVRFLSTVKFKFWKSGNNWGTLIYLYSYINLLLDQITRWPSKLLIVFGSTCTYLGGIDLEWRNLYNYFKVHLYCPNIVNLLCTQICDFYGDNLCLENKWRQDVRNLYIRRCIKLNTQGCVLYIIKIYC